MRGPAGPALMTWGIIAMSACTSPRPVACPGDALATLHLHGELVAAEAGTCPFQPAAGTGFAPDFTATIADTGGGTAALCVDRLEAQPLGGTLQGDHVIVGTNAAPAAVAQCACSLQVDEALEGDLVRVDGRIAGFTGELRDTFSAPAGVDPASCERPSTDGAPTCGVTCALRWQVTSVP